MNEKRRSYRCPALDEQPAVLTTARGKRLSGRILNRSAGGYAVAVEGNSPIEHGDVVKLLTEGDACRAKAVRVQQTEDGWELGLQRLDDLEQHVHVRSSWSVLRLPLTARPSDGMFLAGLAVVGLLGSGLFFWSELSTWFRTGEPPFSVTQAVADAQSWSRSPSRNGHDELHRYIVEKQQSLQQLGSADVMQQLGLSAEQQENIRRILSDAGSRLLGGSTSSSSGPDSETSWKIIQQAHAEALSVLSEKQRQRLKSLGSR